MKSRVHHADDRLHEECGVVGVFGLDEAALRAVPGLNALQHRGEEGCGIAALDAGEIRTRLRVGQVGENFGSGKADKIRRQLPGHAAIGHTRYSTAGGSTEKNLQPFVVRLERGQVALAHNGNLTNAGVLERQLTASGSIFNSTSDTEVILQLMARPQLGGNDVVVRFASALQHIEGGYALVGLSATDNVMFAARDPNGIRPLVQGELKVGKQTAVVLASETCALKHMGAEFVRNVAPGELLVVRLDGAGKAVCQTTRFAEPAPYRPDIFEFIYFSRPDSAFDGISISGARYKMGEQLAAENADIVADIVVPVPDSGRHAALGFAAASGTPLAEGIVRSHYVGRTFILPTQDGRDEAVSHKHTIDTAVVTGRHVALVDDSLVRGTTMRQLVTAMLDSGAASVSVLIACPPILHGDYYGIDMPARDALFAVRYANDSSAMQQAIGASELRFLSLDGIYRAILNEPRNPLAPQLADHVLTGEYPTPLADCVAGFTPR